MRLFLAINFSKEVKDQIMSVITRLKPSTVQGRFTLLDNLHLTLVFIGETNKVECIKQAMDAIDANCFDLQISGFGKFRRDGGDIYWLGVEKNESLYQIQKQLSDSLKRAGFAIENRAYKPHLTLGREVIPTREFNEKEFARTIPPMQMYVNRISLLESERINGKLTYTEIYGKELGK